MQLKDVPDNFSISYERSGRTSRPSKIATLALGCADGLMRAWGRGNGRVIVNGRFAPTIGIKLQPWLNKGPLLSIDWERSIKGVNKSNLEYDRWEVDAQWKYHIPGLRLLNMRAGFGLYTTKETDYFLDFTNFRDENLPEGWNDDWSGNFQLLGSREYNVSDYYLRANLSYESPLLLATWIPYLGKYIEKERFYVSGVLLEKTRPYIELGYGFTNRYISVGAFASFRNAQFDQFGMKFDFELFRRW